MTSLAASKIPPGRFPARLFALLALTLSGFGILAAAGVPRRNLLILELNSALISGRDLPAITASLELSADDWGGKRQLRLAQAYLAMGQPESAAARSEQSVRRGG